MSNIIYLSNCLWRVFSAKSSVDTLPHLVFAELWSCLIQATAQESAQMEIYGNDKKSQNETYNYINTLFNMRQK